MKNFFALLFLISPAAWSAESPPSPKPSWFNVTNDYQVEIASAPLKESMQKFSEATNAIVTFGSHDAFGVRTNAIKGKMTPEEALSRMLAGTGLTYQVGPLGHVVIDSRGRTSAGSTPLQRPPH